MKYVECDVNIKNSNFKVLYCEESKKILYRTVALDKIVSTIVEACLKYDTNKVHITGDFKTTMEVLFSVQNEMINKGRKIEVV